MSNELVKQKNDIWGRDHYDLVHKLYAPDTNNTEYDIFRQLARSLGADPRKREIFPVVYNKDKPDKRKMSIFLSRDFYRRKAQEQLDYNGHRVEAVYENDIFTVKNGQYNHEWNHKNRGVIVGAYAIGWRKGIDHEFSVYILKSEYDKGENLWKDKKETMVKKVPEAQLLRMMYTGLYGSLYSEDEQEIINAEIDDGEKYKKDPPTLPEKTEDHPPVNQQSNGNLFPPKNKDDKKSDKNYAELINQFLIAKYTNPHEAENFLEEISGFEKKDKDTGEIKKIPGKRTVAELSLARQKVTYHKIEKL